MSNKYYLTTPIYYPSGKFHIGTSYTEVLADEIKKYHKLKGEDVFLLTGTDEHGQKIEEKAKEAGLTPKEYVDNMDKMAKELWSLMKIDYDKYIRTTDEYHVKSVQEIFEKFIAQGDIYKGEYVGWYCVPCEGFFTETQLVDGKCPDCGREVKKMKEEAYFFKMSKYVDRLLKYYDEHPDFIYPSYRKQEMINNFIKPGLEDLCVSRTSFTWGIPVVSDPKHVVYVWLDALTNYINAIGYNSENEEDKEMFKKYWPADVHLVGKDIARFHLIYWPIFLMALDLPLPKHIFVHNWITMKDGKMSKSFGNVIYPETLIDRYGLDALKYFLIKNMPLSNDGVFTPEEFVERYNTDLCNDLGNLLNRTIGMTNKYFDGIVPEYNGTPNEADKQLETKAKLAIENMELYFNKFEFSNSLSAIWELISSANKYIDETAPWALAKEEDEESKKKLESVIYHLVSVLREIAVLIRPLMEDTSNKMLTQLGLDTNVDWNTMNDFTDIKNTKVIEKGQPIFVRLDQEEEIEYIKNKMN